jgi:serine/threonine-protein kinase
MGDDVSLLCPKCHQPVDDVERCPACNGKRPPEGWAPDTRLGQDLMGGIRLTKRLGHGASGSIYLGEDLATGDRIAVKFLHPELTQDPEIVKRFKVEAIVTKSLNVPQVVHTFDFGVLQEAEGETHYLTMEYVEGSSLDRVMAHYGALSLDNALEVTRQLLVALDAAHRNQVIHRDLKPGNLILTKNADGTPLVKILDFGFAKVIADEQGGFLQPTRVTRGQIVLGTPMYISPEQAKGVRDLDGRTDLYSLGVILYRMVAGVPPFEANSPIELIQKHLDEAPKAPSTHRESVPEALDHIILKLLAKHPDDRYPNASAVLDELNREFPAGASRWTVGDLAQSNVDASKIVATMGRYVEDSQEISALAESKRPPGVWVAVAVAAALLLGLALWAFLR